MCYKFEIKILLSWETSRIHRLITIQFNSHQLIKTRHHHIHGPWVKHLNVIIYVY